MVSFVQEKNSSYILMEKNLKETQPTVVMMGLVGEEVTFQLPIIAHIIVTKGKERLIVQCTKTTMGANLKPIAWSENHAS